MVLWRRRAVAVGVLLVVVGLLALTVVLWTRDVALPGGTLCGGSVHSFRPGHGAPVSSGEQPAAAVARANAACRATALPQWEAGRDLLWASGALVALAVVAARRTVSPPVRSRRLVLRG